MVVGKAAYYQTTAPWMCRSSRKRYATRFLSKTIANVMEKEFPRDLHDKPGSGTAKLALTHGSSLFCTEGNGGRAKQ